MQTQLAPPYQGTPDGLTAQEILRKCVHCGFCTATCPTYQLLGDELDGPRGRIYLIKQVLEGETPTERTQQHLDRCLTCRNCESTCPSGVEYGKLLDVGRKVVAAQVPRSSPQRALRWLLKEGLTSRWFAPAMRLGQAMRPLLPAALRAKVPQRLPAGAWPQRAHPRRVLLPEGCVQPAMLPSINHASARVLDAAGVQVLRLPAGGCCGALRLHLDDHSGALVHMRANIDAWWPYVRPDSTQPVEAIVSNASGCGVLLKDYGHQLRHDPAYAAKAQRVSALARDLSELLPDLVPALQRKLAHVPATARPRAKLAYHPPCTLQHGQQLRGGVEQGLRALGFEVHTARTEAHLCCGSAGTYSVLQAALSGQLRERKLGHLGELGADQIVSANIGCITHLQSGTQTPVRHWVEALDEALSAAAETAEASEATMA